MANNWKEVYEKWLHFENLDVQLKQELEELRNEPKELEDAFYHELTFGTGGIRGLIGPGINRMNIYTVRKVVHGLATYILENVVNAKHRGVAIAYDSRYMSKEFAIEAARVLGVHGIRATVFSSARPAPVLSFAVRHLSTAAGIMITASHNPPPYNGLKIYNETGGQILLEEARKVTKAIQKTGDELLVSVSDVEEMEEEMLLHWLGEEIDRAYLERLEDVTKLDDSLLKEEKELKIVYTPLHGTGIELMMEGFRHLNFPHVTAVSEQSAADPEFSTVASPNPEEHQAFTLAIDYGKKENADLLLATDPDADRLGAAVRNSTGEYIVLTGNQLGSLLLDYILSQSDLNIYRNARMIKTVVTTELGRAIAESYGVRTIETLPGFKYIAEKMNTFSSSGETFMFGYEESGGYLANGFTRDKDAIQAAMLTAEMTYYWKKQGKSVLEALESLYEKHGYHVEGLHSLPLKGIEGANQIAHFMEEIRNQPMKEIAGIPVEIIENYVTSERYHLSTLEKERIDLPKENMVKYILEDKTWIAFRPSGTEPKLKYYYGVCAKSNVESEEKREILEQELEQFVHNQLNRV